MDTSNLIVLKVNVYSNEGSITVSLGGQPHKYLFAGLDSGQDMLCSYRNVVTAEDVRERARQMLNLKPLSGRAFGLFTGPLGYPTALLHDSDPVPLDGSVFSYQRLCFSQADELAAIRDEKALELIFREVKDMFENHKIHPWISFSQRDTLLDLLDRDQLEGPYLNSLMMRKFLEEVQSFPKFYWSYFYYVSNCVLTSQLKNGMKLNAWYTITADINQLIVLDIIMNDEVTSWKWEELNCMKMKKFTIEFEVADRSNSELVCVTFSTDRSQYLFSVILHILRILHAISDRPILSKSEDSLTDPINPPHVIKKDEYICAFLTQFLFQNSDCTY